MQFWSHCTLTKGPSCVCGSLTECERCVCAVKVRAVLWLKQAQCYSQQNQCGNSAACQASI